MKTILRYQKTKVMGGRLKVVTYNVNGLRQRIAQFGSLLNLLSSLDADIICFQEIKLTRQELTADLVMAEGYESFFSCTRTYGKGRIGYSGVATFCRVKSAYSSTEATLPVAAEEGFTGLLESSRGTELRNGETFADVECLEEFTREELLKLDNEGRCIITDHGHFVLFNIYGPRADSDDAERIEFKSNFYKVLQKRWEALQQQKRRIIVVGDLNIAPAAVDRCEAGPDFEKNEFRKWFRSLLVKNGGSFYDIFREKHPERKDAYTCWPVHTGAEEFNFGSRIDHILASGLCLHQVDDPSGHNLLDCHVEECDIMTQFRRWKPGITPRWNGGRITKLEGSDHVPVYAALKEVHDSPLHNTPPLSARYIPEIRGFQQTIVSILMKRKMSEQINVSVVSSSSPNEDSKHLTLSENAEATLPTCSVSSMDVVEDDSKCSENVENMTKTKSEHNSLIYGTQKKKKVKQNQHSQLSLKSFFQRVSNSESVGNPDEDMPRNEENISNSYNFPKEIPEFNDEIRPERNASTEERDEPTASCSSQNDKNAALLEWRRIQQLMQDSIPLCEGHREPCVSRVVKKPGTNFGRRFYCCARAEGPTSNPETRCDFFRWAGSKPKRK